MKNKIELSVLGIIVFFIGISVLSCTKEGPPGPPGADGDNGIQTCYSCHNMSESLVAIITQWEHSVHGEGANIDRNYYPCSECHTSMGFRYYLNDSMVAAIDNPTPINCRTCHKIHETYSYDDFALRTTDSVMLEFTGEIYDYGNSNICANCHHARTVDPLPVPGGNDVTIDNKRYGPHHGTQADMLAGKGGFEIEGSIAYLNSSHTNHVDEGCVTCHMAPASGIHSGGHQMNIQYMGHYGTPEYEYTGCYSAACHQDEDEITALIEPNRILIDSLITDLEDTLLVRGILNSDGSIKVPITLSSDVAGALLNYQFVLEDRSLGAHNFKYTRALLLNSLEALEE